MVLPKLHEKFTEAQLQIIWNAMAVEMGRWVEEDIRFTYEELPVDLDIDSDDKYDLTNDNSTIPRRFKLMGDIPCKDPHVKGPDGEDLDVQIFFYVRIPNFDPHLKGSRRKYGTKMGLKKMMIDLNNVLSYDNSRNGWTVHKGQGTGWTYNVIFKTENAYKQPFDVEWEINIVE